MTELSEGDDVNIIPPGRLEFDGELFIKGKKKNGRIKVKKGETITTFDKGKKYIMKAISYNCEVEKYAQNGRLINGSWKCIRKEQQKHIKNRGQNMPKGKIIKINLGGKEQKGEIVEIVKGGREYSGVFELSDGYVIELRTLINQIIKLEGTDEVGLPKYGVRSNTILATKYEK